MKKVISLILTIVLILSLVSLNLGNVYAAESSITQNKISTENLKVSQNKADILKSTGAVSTDKDISSKNLSSDSSKVSNSIKISTDNKKESSANDINAKRNNNVNDKIVVNSLESAKIAKYSIGVSPSMNSSSPPVLSASIPSFSNGMAIFNVSLGNLTGLSDIEHIDFAVWSTVNGQDDIKWVKGIKESDGTYKISINNKDHKFDIGEYNIHAYRADKDFSYNFTGSCKIIIPQMSASIITATKTGDDSFQVTVKNIKAPSGITKILIPVWSEVNGQDDIVWYNASRQSEGSYITNISTGNHKWDRGIYIANVYGVNLNNKYVGLGGTTVNFKEITADNNSITKVSNETFKVNINGISEAGRISKIEIPVWSKVNGQDDIVWYNALKKSDGSYEVNVNIKNHKWRSGIYYADSYAIDIHGKYVFLGRLQIEMPNLVSGNISASAINSNTFKVKVSGITSTNGIKRVMIPVWSIINGQDDIVWYKGNRESDGSYSTEVNIKDHKWYTGTYDAHAYVVDNNDIYTILGATTIDLPKAKAESVVATKDSDNTFKVRVSGITSPNGIKIVMIPVWSKVNGQDDIVWYKGSRESDGSYSTEVNIKDHKWDTGTYDAHAYVVDNNDIYTILGATTIDLPNAKAESIVATKDSDNTFKVKVSGITSPNGIKRVMIPVWSVVNGQDDIVWYQASREIDGSYSTEVNIKDHKWDTGTYDAHAYLVDNNGVYRFLGATTIDLPNAKAESVVATKDSDNTFKVRVSGITSPNGIKRVMIPVWSKVNNQDDLVWYQGNREIDGSYTTEVNIKDHKFDRGLYYINVYMIDNSNNTIGIGGTTINIPLIEGSIQATYGNNIINGTLNLTNIAVGIKEIKIPVWSEVNGQDDIVWYTANKINDNQYRVSVDISNHNLDVGRYNMHAYAVDTNGAMSIIDGTSIEVKDVYLSNIGIPSSGNVKVLINEKSNLDISKIIHWTSTDSNVADVDFRGYIVGNNVGNTSISGVDILGNTVHFEVNVTSGIVPTGISFDNSIINLYTGYTKKIITKLSPSNSVFNDIAYTSSNTNIVKIDESGVVTGVSPGTASITGRTVNGIYAYCQVIVKNKIIYKAIDVSEWQKSINWNLVRGDSVDFAMIRDGFGRSGAGGRMDNYFRTNVSGARAAGVQVGAYHYSYASTPAEAISEADLCGSILAGTGIKYVTYDVEDPKVQSHLSKQQITDLVNAFSSRMQSKGYSVIVYSSLSWLSGKMYLSQINDSIWIANWGVATPGMNGVVMWQYASDGRVNGINGNVDLNYLYVKLW